MFIFPRDSISFEQSQFYSIPTIYNDFPTHT